MVEVEQRVEEVEAGDPEADRAAERPRLPRELTRDRDPGADRREAEAGAEPEVAEPRDALQVRVDDEHHDRDRPQPADDRLELEHRDEVDERARARTAPRPARARARRPGAPASAVRGFRASISASTSRFSPIASVRAPTIATVTQAIGPIPGQPSTREQRADVGERQREDRVLEPDEPREPDGKRRRQRAHTGSFVFETSSTPSIRIALSTAFAMS